MKCKLYSLGFLLFISTRSIANTDPTPLEIGSAAPDFSLPATDGKTYSLKNFQADKILTIIFTCNHCPTAQAYEDRINRLVTDYKAKGVAIIAISPTIRYRFASMKWDIPIWAIVLKI